jgi:F-type H+-transporting ATPase subunit delta
MSVTRIATRYAKSLLDLALQQNKLEAVNNDIHTLRAAAKNRELYLMLKSPVITADKKTAVLDALFSKSMDSLTMAYLHLLVHKGREMYLPEIASEFEHQYKVLNNITTVKIISAEPLSDAVIDALRSKLLASGATSEKIDVQTAVDPKLIGGFVLQFDDKRYDASIAQKLEDMKTQFSKNLYIKEF